ncbi:MAG: hybrid sensor histidine kinase/response regulator transcription factor [Jejuia sp.]
MRFLKDLLVIISVVSCIHSFGQEDIQFHRITTDDGLSQSDINCIYQDNQGFLWFGTHEGLNKYDGYNFKIFSPNGNDVNSISSNLIFDITGDKNGNLWIGTTGKGLDYFNIKTEKFKHFVHDKNNPNSLISNYVTSLLLDDKNRLWIGTSNGLDVISLDEPLDAINFQHYNLERDPFNTKLNDNVVNDIFQDSQGEIWIAGDAGFFKLNRDSNGDLYVKRINEIIGLSNIPIRSINEDVYGRLLIGSNHGFFMLNRDGGYTVKKVTGRVLTNEILVNNTTIWVGTDEGLLYFDNSDGTAIPKLIKEFKYEPDNRFSISKNRIKSLLKDKGGVIWIGTNGGGLNKLDLERKKFKLIKKTLDSSSLSYDKIRSLYEDSNGTLWVGTEGGELNFLPQNNYESYLGFSTLNNIKNAFVIKEIEVNGKKILLVGSETHPGLYSIDITNPKRIKELDNSDYDGILGSVFSILEDSNKNLWIGTYGKGLVRWIFDKATKTYKKDIFTYSKTGINSISNNIIRNIMEDRQGNIWLATGDGLCKLSKAEKEKKHPVFSVYKKNPMDSTSISHNYILELFESAEGQIWIGTLGGGICKYIPASGENKDYFVPYKVKDGLPNNVVKGILEDNNNNLWISTNKGLSKFDPGNIKFTNFDINDGLQSNEFQELARLKRQNGELLFGGINGFNAFYPENIKGNSYETETVITKFSIFNKEIGIGQKIDGKTILGKSINTTGDIKLKHNQNSISFEFSSLHYASPQKNKYAYMLEGFDENWIYTSSERRFANYTNLEPDNYTFLVKASNNDGVWDTSASKLNIEITPPFWRTTLAYTFYFLITLGLLILFRRYTIIGTNEKYKLELDHLEKEKNEELQRIKFEFFTNISHELRTPLTLLKGPLKYLQKRGKGLDDNEIQEQYKLMERNSDSLLRLVNQLLDFRKISQGKMRLVMRQGDIVSFIRQLSEPFQFLVHKNQIYFEISSNPEIITAWFDHEAIEKIINNLLSNAFKFTPQGGEIKIYVSIDEYVNNVIIEVKDSGCGIEPEKLKNIFERFYIDKSRDESNPEGIGIGLSYAEQLVALHQGSISVESELNIGTTFTVQIPVERKAYENIPEITCKNTKDADFHVRTSETDSIAISLNDEITDLDIEKSRADKPILLVIDDKPDIRLFLKRALKNDYIVHEAPNGRVGLEMTNKIVPNIIISDILMPEMNGIDFCKKIKSQRETSHIPVIMLTAKLSQESEIRSLKTGADDYIRKPFDIELLELKLNNIIKQREQLRNRFKNDISFEPKDVTVTTLDEKFLQQAIEIVEKHMMNTSFNVEMLVKEMGLSRSTLFLKFKEITGLSTSAFIRNIRLKRAVQLFEKSDYSVKEIMYMTGFNTASYFSSCFKKQFGVLPSEYVRQNINQVDKDTFKPENLADS